ncbi:MAG: DUF5723 family protein [Candidatus Neomarinimicrobiota bacterium]
MTIFRKYKALPVRKRVVGIVRNSDLISRLVIILAAVSLLNAQNYDNPIARAMGGSNTAMSRGLFCIGHNPANLGLSAPYRTYFQVFGLNYYITNNFYSLESGTHFGGQDLTADGGKLQQEFQNSLPEDGWRLTTGLTMPVPLVNFSTGNKAFTTNLIYATDYYISRDALDVIFGDWEKGTVYDLDLRCDAMTAVEYAYSMAIPYGEMSIGFSLKYLQGLGYYGLDPAHSTSRIAVDTTDFVLYGAGDYYFRESNSGRGFGADIGIAFEDINGWNLGISVLNLGESIKWNSETMLSKTLGNGILSLMGGQIKNGLIKNTNLKLDFEGESYRYNFQIDSLDASDLFRGDSTYQELFSSSKLIGTDSTTFRVKIPLVLKIGLARNLQKDLMMAIDFSACFDDRLNYRQGWRTAVGFEYSHFPKTPLRVGLAVGDISGWEFNIGSGLALGPLHVDWAIGMDRSLWAHSMQGLDFAVSTYFVKKEKSK